MKYIMQFQTCESCCRSCRAPCFDKPGPTSVRSSIRARRRAIIRSIETRHPNDPTNPAVVPARLTVDARTWFAPIQTSYQQPNAGDIAIFNVWRALTQSHGVGGLCAGR